MRRLIYPLTFLVAFLFLWVGLREGRVEQRKILVVIGAKLVNGTGAPPVENSTIVIENGRFTAVGRRAEIPIPKGAEVIDVKNKIVVPGLIDAHVHFTYPPKDEEFLLINEAISTFRSARFLHDLLMVGVTTVRDVASYNTVGIVAKKAFDEGLLIGSRPIVTGQGITSTGGHGTESYSRGIVLEVDGPEEFRKGVRTQLKAGADLVKILCPYSREEIKAAVEETHAHERFVTVHPSMLKKQFDFLYWPIEAGADCLEHAYAIPDDAIKMMAQRGIYCVPTLSILLMLGEQHKKQGPEREWKVKKYFESEEIFSKMNRAGIKMAVGTDAVVENMISYPWIYFEEVERFVKNGYSPMEAIVAATKIGAEVCDALDILGTIEKGKLADLLVLEGDPLKDIRDL